MASTQCAAVDIAMAQANFWVIIASWDAVGLHDPRHGPVSVAAQREAVMNMSLSVEFTVH
jgi:hypothetical protein